MKALVLSGGGAKGSYQLGVWKALRELNIKFDIITGTSVGALNGALIVQNSYYKAKKIWNTMSFETIFGKTNYKTETELDIYKMYGKEFMKAYEAYKGNKENGTKGDKKKRRRL